TSYSGSSPARASRRVAARTCPAPPPDDLGDRSELRAEAGEEPQRAAVLAVERHREVERDQLRRELRDQDPEPEAGVLVQRQLGQRVGRAAEVVEHDAADP